LASVNGMLTYVVRKLSQVKPGWTLDNSWTWFIANAYNARQHKSGLSKTKIHHVLYTFYTINLPIY